MGTDGPRWEGQGAEQVLLPRQQALGSPGRSGGPRRFLAVAAPSNLCLHRHVASPLPLSWGGSLHSGLGPPDSSLASCLLESTCKDPISK